MSTPWTPGPWAVVGAKEPADGGIDHAIVTPMAGKSTVIAEAFDVVGEGVRAPSQANAQLIAAAPDLYAALSGLVEMYVAMINSGDCGNWDPEKEKEVIAARAALAKARGEA